MSFPLLAASIALVFGGLPTLAETKSSLPPATPKRPPNIILMVADDLGYGDLSCYGATRIATPHIDALAREGVRFTDAHSYSGICMPSRYALLTGRYTFRLRRSMDYACNFDAGQILLPGALQAAGYRTAAIGKWHNGFGSQMKVDWNADLKPGPLEFGFDAFFGTPRTHSEPPLVFVRDHRIVGLDPADPISVDQSPGTGAHGRQVGGTKALAERPADQVDLRLAEEAKQFLAKQSTERPFFLYLSWVSPHHPLMPSPRFQGSSSAGTYGDFIQQLDHCVGEVLAALRAHGQADNTIVVFTSDNGGRYFQPTTRTGHRPNGELLGQKTDAWEGGHRVALLARWPGRIPGGTVRKAYFHHVDVMATLVDLAGVTMPAGASPDGRPERAAWLEPEKAPVGRAEGIHHGTNGLALRRGAWVYLPKPGSGGKTVPEPAKPWSIPFAQMKVSNSDVDERGQIKADAPQEQLYHLGEDLAQRTNRAAGQPALVQELRERLRELTAPASTAPDIRK